MSFSKIQNIEEQLDKIRKFLPQYMAEHGFDISGSKKILCINPEHNDSSPSMSAFHAHQGYDILKCFSCGFVADIFNACHILEHKPLIGPGFIDDTVVYLADKYGVELQMQKMSEEEIYEMNMYQAYSAAARFISASPLSQIHFDELQRRGWNQEAVKKIGIGTCPNIESLREHLKTLGFSSKFLDETDFDNDRLFNNNNLIFTIYDEYGRPVGFSARNLKYDGVKDDLGRLVNGPKFVNTKTNEQRCNIYRKQERLYMFNVAKQKSSTSLFIFEGNGDAVTAQLHGIHNAVAVCGVGLNEHHFNLCRRHGIYDVVICLDGDNAGMTQAKKILDEVLKKVHDLRIRFIFLPEQTAEVDGRVIPIKMDPDEFIRRNGSEAFLNLPKIHPFTWRLSQFDEDQDANSESICMAMVPIISCEPSAIKREGMIRELTEYTGISEKAIREEIDRISHADEARVQRAKDAVVDEVINALKSRSEIAETVLSSAIDKIHNIDREHKSGMFDTSMILSDILAIKQYQESEDMHTAFDFGAYFRTLNSALSGDLRGKMVLLGGVANTGKTSTLVNWSWELVQNNESAMSVFLTIDDSKKEFIPRVLCYDICKRSYGTHKEFFDVMDINKVATPYLFKDNPAYDAIMAEREQSFNRLYQVAQNDRYVVLDTHSGRTLDFIGTIIRYYASKYPDRHLFFFLDNFHLVNVPGYEDGRAKYKHLSHELKNLAVKNDCTIISTAEYKKVPPERKPNNNDLAESVALEYDSNAILHLDSEMHRCRDATFNYFHDNNNKYPIIEQIFGKNKINSFKSSIYYKFWPEKAFYIELSEREFRDLTSANRALAGVGSEDEA